MVKLFTIFILILLLTLAATYMFAPVYNFEQREAFNGNKLYNPYAAVDSSMWRKGNFHSHQRLGYGVKNAGYLETQMIEAYTKNGYDIVGISDHQYINRVHSERQGFIPTYEHGYGLNLFHLLMLGSHTVSWADFLIAITPSQLQYALLYHKPQAQVIVLNHPGTLRIIDKDYLYANLEGYDLFEINPDRDPKSISAPYWDIALSNGIYSNLIADDDAHTIFRHTSWFQRAFTMVNTPSLSQDDILSSLTNGRAYAVTIPAELNGVKNVHHHLPKIKEIGVKQGAVSDLDTISSRIVSDSTNIYIKLSEPAQTIRFIGQNGAVLDSINDQNSALYRVAPDDNYVRVEAEFKNGTFIYSNPFVKTNDGKPEYVSKISINSFLSILSNLICVSVMLMITSTLLLTPKIKTNIRRNTKRFIMRKLKSLHKTN